jgi:hypothetical protein
MPPFIIRTPRWPDPRVKPPLGAAGVDWSHPLARDLVALWLFNEGGGEIVTDLCARHHGKITLPTVVTWKPSLYGPAVDSVLTGSSTTGITVAPAVVFAASSSFTYRGRFFFRASDTLGALLCQTNSIGVYVSSGKFRFIDVPAANTTLVANTWYEYAVTRSGSSVAYFKDGQADGTQSGNSAWSPDSMCNNIGSNSFDGLLAYQQLWRRQLSADEVAWLYAEPFAMLRPIVRRRYAVILPEGFVDHALEIDTAQGMTSAKVKAVGQANETDLAQAIAVSTARIVQQAREADLAQPIRPARAYPLVHAQQIDTAQPVTARKVVAVGLALEMDAAQAIESKAGFAIGHLWLERVPAGGLLTSIEHAWREVGGRLAWEIEHVWTEREAVAGTVVHRWREAKGPSTPSPGQPPVTVVGNRNVQRPATRIP